MTRLQANLLLTLTAVIWGSTFVVQRIADATVEPMAFTGARFLLAALAVLPFAGRRAPGGRRLTAADALGIAATGGALYAAALLQQIGIGRTSVANAGFLTALYVPLVPLIGLAALRQVPHPVVWPAAAGCLAAAWLLSGAGAVSIAPGDLWVIAGAVFWAAHVLLVGAMVRRTGAPLTVAAGQFLVCGALGAATSAAVESTGPAALLDAWWTIAYCGLLAGALAYSFQAIAQRHTAPADTAVILSGETVVAAVSGAVVLGERLPAPALAGCALMLTCILTVELLPLRRRLRACTP
ncbi:DMT family transporter [Azospirillum sp. ST 5-10]|uniref:DMT family transporter n=1 Tax=unclassified Azospirillum TaxID=2630922 RepID=UPI003F4A6C1C